MTTDIFTEKNKVGLYHCVNCNAMTNHYHAPKTYKWFCGKCKKDNSLAYLYQKEK